MRWLLRQSRNIVLIAGMPKVGLTELRRTLATICRAVVLPRFGGPEVLELGYVNIPNLRANEVLVRARPVSVDPLDCRMRSGYGRSMTGRVLPLILGRYISGEVAAIGHSVRSLTVGQEVFGALHPTALRGTYTDYAILAEEQLTLKPENMSHVEASAIPFAALTAWRVFRFTARIKEGQRVLVIGAGAIGFSATQLAVAAGCHVSVTCNRDSVERMLAAGAGQAVDYTTEDCESSIEGFFDAVLDTIGTPETERMGINLLLRGGHYMKLQGEATSNADTNGIPIGTLMTITVLQLKLPPYLPYRLTSHCLEEIRRLSAMGKLKVPVLRTYPMEEVREAHEAMDKGILPGKVVIVFD